MPAEGRKPPRGVASGTSRDGVRRRPGPPARVEAPRRSAPQASLRQGGRQPRRQRFVRRHAKGIALLLVAPPALVVVALLWYARSIPLPADELSAQTTFVYDSGGEVMASLDAGVDRTAVLLGRVPRLTIDAVLASEDHNFYQHGGVDPVGVGRALWADVRSRGSLQGGSTITQQYVKVTYLGRERTFRRKLREAILAVKLERRLSKDQILERYLNAVYFGRGAYGVQAAAQAYFGVDVERLDLAQSAYLAGLLRAPEHADARRNLPLALARRQRVLDAMVRFELITSAQRDQARSVPLTGAGGTVRSRPGPTSTYEQAGSGSEYATDMVRRQLIERFGAARVFGGGLRVRTTIDLAMQRSAWSTLFDDVLNRPGDPDAAMVVLDHGGRVRAMVGGRDWSVSQVNLAVGRGYGGIGRQGGSTFKPFVLATAVRAGIPVGSTFDAPAAIDIPGADQDGSDWRVSNYDGESFSSPVDLARSTALSLNTVYAQLVTDDRVGPQRVVTMAAELGIRSPLEAYPAVALGAEEVAPLEMADAYLTFARGGEQVEPTLIAQVTDATGEVLFTAEPSTREVLTRDEAAVVNGVLMQVVREGTGVGAQLSDGRQVAGKTGTTQSSRDAWFVGYTPQRCCVVAVWMGYADTNRPMVKVHGRRVTGGAFPADVFRRFMEVAVVDGGVDTGGFRVPVTTPRPGTVAPGAGSARSVRVSPQPSPQGASDTTGRLGTVVQVERPAVTGVGGTDAASGGPPVDPAPGGSGPIGDGPTPVPVPVPGPANTVTEPAQQR